MKNSKSVFTSIEKKVKLIRKINNKTIYLTCYKILIRSLKYLSATRSYIVFGVSLLSRFMEESCMCHLQGDKIILRYFNDTLTE